MSIRRKIFNLKELGEQYINKIINRCLLNVNQDPITKLYSSLGLHLIMPLFDHVANIYIRLQEKNSFTYKWI